VLVECLLGYGVFAYLQLSLICILRHFLQIHRNNSDATMCYCLEIEKQNTTKFQIQILETTPLRFKFLKLIFHKS